MTVVDVARPIVTVAGAATLGGALGGPAGAALAVVAGAALAAQVAHAARRR